MKRLLILLLIASGVYAQDYTTTPNLGLKLPKQGSTNWGPYVNQDFTSLDAAVGAFHGGFVTVPFSPTPVFNLVQGNTFQLTLSGNVTSSTVNQPNITSGQIMYFIICQDSTGGHSFAFPASFQAPLPTVTPTATQCSATTWIWSTPLNQWVSTGGGSSGGGGGGGDTGTQGIQYVTGTGSDAHDGLTWSTAKATPYAALLALPNGSSSPPRAGNGIVYVANNSNGISFGGPVAANQGGWWMFGPGDPGYAGGVTGWMRAPTSGTVTLECGSPTAGVIHQGGAVCQEFWGGHADNVHPAIWFSSFSSQAVLRGFGFNYEATGMKIGIDSTNSRSANTGNSSVWLDRDQVNFGNCYAGVGAGPALDIGGASFWINITHGSYSGCITQDYTATAVRASNVVTLTLNTSATGDISAGGNNYIIVRNMTDPTFNGAYAITSASGTSVTFAQLGPDASTSGGQVFPYGAAAIGINSGTGPGAGFVYVDDVAVNGGGIWAQGGFNGVGLSAKNIVYEGSGSPDMSPVELLPTNPAGDTFIEVNDVQPADNTVPICGVEALRGGSSQFVTNAHVCGSMTNQGGSVTATSGTGSPLRQGMYGQYNGHTIAINSDSARKMFSPYAIPAGNQVGFSSSGWTTTGLTVNTGQLAPDHTSNAVQLINPTGSTILMNFGGFFGGATPNLGDYYIYGVWLRSETAGALPLGPNFNLNSSGLGAGDYCAGSYFSGQGVSALGANVAQPSIIGDGQWNWYSGVCKIITNPTGGNQRFDMNVAANTTIDAYGPVLTLVPAADMSDNEAWETANTLQSYPKQSVIGDVSMLPGQRFAMGVPGSTTYMYFHEGTPTASRTITWPDDTFTVPSPNVANTWSANQTFTNGTELRFLSSNATNYAGFKGGASTSNLVWLFPTTDASGTQCLSSNGSLQLAWSACSAGTGTPGGADTNVQYNSSGTFAGSGNFTFDGTGTVGIGLANTTLGHLKMFGSTSGDVTLQPQAVAGTATVLTAPNTTGTIADGASTPLSLSATTGNLTCVTCTTNASALTANHIVLGAGSQATTVVASLGTATTVLHGNAAAPTFAAVDLTADVTGVLPIANGGTSGATAAAGFDALAPTTTQGDIILRGASTNQRLPIGANGTCLVSNGTTAAYGSCASGSVSGNAVSGQGTFWNGTSTLGGHVNWLYSAASGHSVIQGANNTDLLYGHRFTDSSPTGNFFRFQNAAANADVAKLDVNGNLTVTSVNFNGTGASGTVNLFQGTAPALVANTLQLTAPASVAAGGIQFIYPGTPASGFIRWTNLTGVETGAFSAASGVGACAGGLFITGLNDNGAPTCSALTPGGFGSQTANTFLGAPNGSPGLPTFRALVAADIPSISLSGGGLTGILPIANGGTNGNSASSGFNNLSPMTTAGDIIYGGSSGVGTRLAPSTAVTLLHSGTTPSWSAVALATDVSGTLPIANGGTGQTTAGPAFNALAPAASVNAVLYATGTNAWGQLAAGNGCLQESAGGTPTWGSCGGGGSANWDAIGNPAGDLSLVMGTNNSLFTSGVMVGTRKAWEYTDGNSTSTGPFFNIHTGTTSTMPPIVVTAKGTANGISMTNAGSLGVIGSGHIVADQLSRTITTTTPLTIGGGSSADLTSDRTLACATCVTSSAALTSNGVIIGSGGGQGTASTAVGTSGQVLTSNGIGLAPTFQASTAVLSSITSAAATNTLTNGDNPQIWNSQQATNNQAALTFGETGASTAGSLTGVLANQANVKISTAAGSTASPLSIIQGSVGATNYPALQVQTTWNSSSLVGQGLVVSVTDTSHAANSKLINIYGGASGTTSEFSVDTAGTGTLLGGLVSGGTIRASSTTNALTFQGGVDASSAGSASGAGTFKGGNNSSATAASAGGAAFVRGGDETGSAAAALLGGNLTMRGGNVSATGTSATGGIVTITGGSCTAVASASTCPGTVQVQQVSFTTGVAVQNDLACVTAANTVASCTATGAGQFVGVIDSVTSNNVFFTSIASGGRHTFNALSSGFTNGHFVCQDTSTTNGNLVVDSATACAVGLGIGIYVGTTGTTTTPLVMMRPY